MRTLQKICLLGLMVPAFALAATKSASNNTQTKQQKQTSQETQPPSQTINLSDTYEPISYVPRLYAAGYAGDDLVTQGDLLIPLGLTNENAFVIYGQGRYSPGQKENWEDDTWMGSGGLLYRQIVADKAVLGAYVLGEYNQSYGGHRYWSIGPGLESLGRTWDFHLNGYIPLGNTYWKNEAWAHEFGNYNYMVFQEGTNNVYDHLIAYYEETGIGGDAEVGRKLFKVHNTLVKGYLQGYYYNMDHNSDITGGGVKVTVQPSRYVTFSANDTYDNYNHNTFMLGAQVRLNDLFNKSNKPIDENNLTTRLLDPIDRNYGTIGAGTNAPTTTGPSYDLGGSLFTSNGVFFDDNGSGYISPNADQYAKGTYGNPYTEEGDLNNNPNGMQGIFDTIRGYNTSTAPGNVVTTAVQLPDGMTIWGRGYWYNTPLTGNDRSLFKGSFQLMGDNSLDSIRIENVSAASSSPLDASTGTFTSGILIDGSTNITLNNIEVGALNGTDGYITAIYLKNSASATVDNSQIYGYAHPDTVDLTYGFAPALGIRVSNSTMQVGNNNTIIADSKTPDVNTFTSRPYLYAFAAGVWVENGGNLIVGDNNYISGNAVNGALAINGASVAINVAGADGIIVRETTVPSTVSIGSNNTIIAQTTAGTLTGSFASTGTSYIYAESYGVLSHGVVNINGDDNSFIGISHGGNGSTIGSAQTINAYANAFGLGSTPRNNGSLGEVNINGTDNTFEGDAVGGDFVSSSGNYYVNSVATAYGMLLQGVNANLGNGNNYIANAQGGYAEVHGASATANASATAYGIYANNAGSFANYIYLGDNNSMIVTADGGTVVAGTPGTATSLSYTYGIYAISKVTVSLNVIMGSYNYFLLSSTSGTATGGTTNRQAYSYGIYNSGTVGTNKGDAIFTFAGGNNEFVLTSNAKGTSLGYTYGIYNTTAGAKIIFDTGVGTGNNEFYLTANNDGTNNSEAYLIYLNTTTGGFYQDSLSNKFATADALNSFLFSTYGTQAYRYGGTSSSSKLIFWNTSGESIPWPS